jgi:ketosteroid isomerase-like protein
MPGSATARLSPACRRGVNAGWAIATVLALAVCAIPAHSAFSLAQKHENRHEIDQLEDEWRNAVLTLNTKAMDSLLGDDYVAITASGTVKSREEELENLRSGRVRFTLLNITDRKVRFYGNGSTAVVTSLADIRATTPDGEVAGNYRYMRVYVRNAQGVWKIVSFEASRVREPGPHKRSEFH